MKTRLSDHFHTYIGRYLRLRKLASAGLGDSDEADELRDSMDLPWQRLSREEVDLVKRLSIDIAGSEFKGSITRLRNPEVVKLRVLAAYQSKNWHELIDAIRRADPLFPAGMASYLRGWAWFQLGEPNLAAVFFKRAVSLNPANTNYQVLALEALARGLDKEEAARESRRHLSDPNSHPYVLAQAASTLFALTKEQDRRLAQQTFRELIPVLEDATERAALLPVEERVSAQEIAAKVILGMCYEQVGGFDRALDCYNEVLEIEPHHEAALCARGIMAYGIDNVASVRDFATVAALDSILVWPFFFLAHNAIVNDRYGECLRFSEIGLARPSGPVVRASLLEWKAISMAMTGAGEAAEVIDIFLQALPLAPDAPTIQKNLNAYREALAHSSVVPVSPIRWSMSSTDDARTVGLSRLAA